MAFDKKLLPAGAITLLEFMKKHDPKEIEGYKVSYLLPTGRPLNYAGKYLERLEVEVMGGTPRLLACRPPHVGIKILANEEFGWGATGGWGGSIPREVADDSVIAVLNYETAPKHGSVGKPAEEWLEMEGFDPEWLEGARFEGGDVSLTRDPLVTDPRRPRGWNPYRTFERGAWSDYIHTPWVGGATLHLTPENEAKALTAGTLSGYRVTKGHHEGWYDLTRLIVDDLPVDFEALRGTDFRLRFKNASQFWVQGRFTGSAESPDIPASSHRHWRINDDLRTVMRKAWNSQEGARILVRDVTLLDGKGTPTRAIDAQDLPDDSVVEVVNQENGDVQTAHISTGKLRGNNGAILGKSFVITKVLYRHKQAGRNGEN